MSDSKVPMSFEQAEQFHDLAKLSRDVEMAEAARLQAEAAQAEDRAAAYCEQMRSIEAIHPCLVDGTCHNAENVRASLEPWEDRVTADEAIHLAIEQFGFDRWWTIGEVQDFIAGKGLRVDGADSGQSLRAALRRAKRDSTGWSLAEAQVDGRTKKYRVSQVSETTQKEMERRGIRVSNPTSAQADRKLEGPA